MYVELRYMLPVSSHASGRADTYGTTGIDDSSSTPTDAQPRNPLPNLRELLTSRGRWVEADGSKCTLSSHSFQCHLCVLLTVPPQPSLLLPRLRLLFIHDHCWLGLSIREEGAKKRRRAGASRRCPMTAIDATQR
ncbi:uncharacterized protein ARMOST_02513 [Armillaria ostoyae]|uniref:Uncharacterized protein n=1 Tax=Armillaria ostoyae TaxID=47428 RepID=A0A284QRX0_ARMOS|nr:uncharacterized protein ARMOST_02513 [Armillaria ostoyae]